MNSHILARMLHGDVSGPNSILCPGPGHSAKDRSLAVKIVSDRLIAYSFAGDDPLDCLEYVYSVLGWSDYALGRNRPSLRDTDKAARFKDEENKQFRLRKAKALWDEATAIKGTAAEAYLRNRGISSLEHLYAGDAIRFHAQCVVRCEGENKRLPAMVSLMTN